MKKIDLLKTMYYSKKVKGKFERYRNAKIVMEKDAKINKNII